MNKQDEQIVKLNSTVKVKLGASKIHGIGIIALRDIKEGEKLHCIPSLTPMWHDLPYGSLSKLFPEIKELILERWPSIINGSHFLSPNDMAWLITYMNHSNDPNYNVDNDLALKDIKVGEEITEDYRRMTNYQKVYPWIK